MTGWWINLRRKQSLVVGRRSFALHRRLSSQQLIQRAGFVDRLFVDRLFANCTLILKKTVLNHKEFAFMKRIHKVAVLGAGTMGDRLAAHGPTVGVPVLRRDRVPCDVS